MRYPASEKAEIIRLVEASHLSARRTLDKLGIPRATFYRWYDRYLTGGVEALADHRSRPDRVWNRIPDPIRAEIVDLALRETDLSPRELAVRFTDEKSYFVSEASHGFAKRWMCRARASMPGSTGHRAVEHATTRRSAPGSGQASLVRIGPMVPGVSGEPCWRKASIAACIASSG